jgi:glycosyltransferase involved in cell wall biosynthesis
MTTTKEKLLAMTNPKISTPIILRNIVKLQYPVEKVIQSTLGLVDEVLLAADSSSEDSTMELVRGLEKKYNTVKVIESTWNLNNITKTGLEFSKQTNIAIDACTGNWILLLQADEAVHENEFSIIRECINSNEYDAYEMVRLYFYETMQYIRKDWTHPIVRLFKKGARRSAGDACNTEGAGTVGKCGAYIYHYARVSVDPLVMSKRILSLDKLFHQQNKLKSEGDLTKYDFSTYNFDCQHKDSEDVGRRKVESQLMYFSGTHPKAFV